MVVCDHYSGTSQDSSSNQVTWTHTLGKGNNIIVLMGIACNYQNYTDYCIGSILVGSQSATRLTATQIGNVMHEVWYLLISSTSQKSNVQITATMRNSAPFKGGCGSVSYFGVNQSTPSSNVSSGNSTAPQVEISLGSSLFHQTVFQSLGIDCGGSPTGSAFNFMSWLDRETFWDNYPDATACIESVGGDSIECSGDPSNYYNYTANAALNQSSNWVYVAVALIDPANADQTISGNLEVQGVLTIDGPKGNWIDMGVIQGMGGAPILQVNQSLMTKNDLVTYGFISSQTDPSKSSGGGAFCIGHGWVGSGAPPVALSGPLICLTDSGVPVQSGSGSFPSMTSGGIGSLFNRTDQHTLNIYTGSGNPPWNVAETTNFSGNYDTLFLVMNNLYTPANLDLGNLTAHGSVVAAHNTLDDGSGNTTINGNVTLNKSLYLSSSSSASIYDANGHGGSSYNGNFLTLDSNGRPIWVSSAYTWNGGTVQNSIYIYASNPSLRLYGQEANGVFFDVQEWQGKFYIGYNGNEDLTLDQSGNLTLAGSLTLNGNVFGNIIKDFDVPMTVSTVMYYLIATLPVSNGGSGDAVRIEATTHSLNTGGIRGKSKLITAVGQRGGFWYSKYYEGGSPQVHVVVYQQTNGTSNVYAYTPSPNYTSGELHYYQFGWFGGNGATLYDNPAGCSTSPSGTLIFDSNNENTFPVNDSITIENLTLAGEAIINGCYLSSDTNNTLRIASSSSSVTIGAQNSSFIHFISNGGLPFYFNNDVWTNGHLKFYGQNGGGLDSAWNQPAGGAFPTLTNPTECFGDFYIPQSLYLAGACVFSPNQTNYTYLIWANTDVLALMCNNSANGYNVSYYYNPSTKQFSTTGGSGFYQYYLGALDCGAVFTRYLNSIGSANYIQVGAYLYSANAVNNAGGLYLEPYYFNWYFTDTGNNHQQCWYNGTTIEFQVWDSGYISCPQTLNQNNAPVYSNINGTLYKSSSSQRYKTDIAYLDDCSWIYNLKPATFYWNTDEQALRGKAQQIGLIAEDVAPVQPLLVYNNAQGQLEGVYYEKLAVPIVVELQKLRARVDQLESQLKQNPAAAA